MASDPINSLSVQFSVVKEKFNDAFSCLTAMDESIELANKQQNDLAVVKADLISEKGKFESEKTRFMSEKIEMKNAIYNSCKVCDVLVRDINAIKSSLEQHKVEAKKSNIALQEKNDELSAVVTKQNTEMTEMKSTILELKEKNDELSAVVAKQNTAMTEMKSTILELKEKNQDFSTKFDQLYEFLGVSKGERKMKTNKEIQIPEEVKEHKQIVTTDVQAVKSSKGLELHSASNPAEIGNDSNFTFGATDAIMKNANQSSPEFGSHKK